MKLSKPQVAIATYFSLMVFVLFFLPDHKTDAVYIAQFLMMATAILSTRPKGWLAISVLALTFGDLIYYISIYRLEMSTNSPAVLISSPLFSLMFIALVIHLYRAAGSAFVKACVAPSQLPVVLFLMAFAAYYIALPGSRQVLESGFNYSNFSNLTSLIAGTPVLIATYIFLTNTVAIQNQALLIGFFTLGVLDFGIQLETIRYGDLRFTYYDILWAFGVFLVSFGLKNFDARVGLAFGTRSVANLVKKTFLLSALLPTLVFSFLVRDILEVSPMYFAFIVVSVFIFGVVVSRFISYRLNHYGEVMKDVLQSKASTDINVIAQAAAVEFSESIIDVYSNIIAREADALEAEKARLSQTGFIYRRMAHDIASPLSVLNLITRFDGDLDLEKKTMLTQATDRIRSIAQDVLKRGRTSNVALTDRLSLMPTQGVVAVLKGLVEEKRMECAGRGCDVKIEFEAVADGTKQVVTEAVELTRVLSNLLNNAIESAELQDAGLVRVAVCLQGEFLKILIIDNGVGFREEIISYNFQQPRSLGKQGGHGIGLFCAFHALRKWNGAIYLTNNGGAQVELGLKLFAGEAIDVYQELSQHV